jgi:hypothetical protein
MAWTAANATPPATTASPAASAIALPLPGRVTFGPDALTVVGTRVDAGIPLCVTGVATIALTARDVDVPVGGGSPVVSNRLSVVGSGG